MFGNEEKNEMLNDLKGKVDKLSDDMFLVLNRTSEIISVSNFIERVLDVDGFDDSVFGQFRSVSDKLDDFKNEIANGAIIEKLDSILGKIDDLDNRIGKLENEFEDIKNEIENLK